MIVRFRLDVTEEQRKHLNKRNGMKGLATRAQIATEMISIVEEHWHDIEDDADKNDEEDLK